MELNTLPQIDTELIQSHWDYLQTIFKQIPSYDCNLLIDEIKGKNYENTKLVKELELLRIVLEYPKEYNQSHCFDKYLYKYNQNPNIDKFIVAKFEQSGGTFELCLFNYFSCRVLNNIAVICLMNFTNQKDQLESRFRMFNKYLSKHNIKPLKITYIRDFKKSDDIDCKVDTDIVVCLYNMSSMKITFEKVCALAYIATKNVSFAYDEIDIPESMSEKSKLKKIHESIINYHPKLIKNIFGVSATTLGDIPGGFLDPLISNIVFKTPSDTWSGIGHPSVKLYIISPEMKDNIVPLIKKISETAILKDNKFIGNLYIDIRNVFQEKYAENLALKIPDLVVIVFNGSTSNNGGKFTIFNAPGKGFRYDTHETEYDLNKCFKLIKEYLENKSRCKFIFINHNMVLRGISIKSDNNEGQVLSITDEIVLNTDTDVASCSQKYQRIAGLNLEPRRVYGLKPMLDDILQYQKHQSEIYMKCEVDSIRNPHTRLHDFINSKQIRGRYNLILSRNSSTKIIKSTGKVPLSMNITRYLPNIKNRNELIIIIKKNISTGMIDSKYRDDWLQVIEYIETGKVNKNQSFILDKQADSIISKHWLLHYNNMKQNKGSCFSAGTTQHSKESKCYIGVMKNKKILGYGECMVVFTDKTVNNVMKIE